jgi:hypothetical protein
MYLVKLHLYVLYDPSLKRIGTMDRAANLKTMRIADPVLNAYHFFLWRIFKLEHLAQMNK